MAEGIFETRTPLEALEEMGINLPEFNIEKLPESFKSEKCEICGKGPARKVKFTLNNMILKPDNSLGIITLESPVMNSFCSKECLAVHMVKQMKIPLTFTERQVSRINNKILKMKAWWRINISEPFAVFRKVRKGHLAAIYFLNKFDRETEKFFIKYLDVTMFDGKTAEKYPNGLLFVSLTDKEPNRRDPFGWGTRFLIDWRKVLSFSKIEEKKFQIYPHKKVGVSDAINITGMNEPGFPDILPVVKLPDDNPGIGIFIPFSEKILVKIGIKRYAGRLNEEFLPIEEICDQENLKVDEAGRIYALHHIQLEWAPDIQSLENFEHQFNEFLKAARMLAKVEETSEIEVLVTGKYKEQTANIDLFMKDWRLWWLKKQPLAAVNA